MASPHRILWFMDFVAVTGYCECVTGQGLPTIQCALFITNCNLALIYVTGRKILLFYFTNLVHAESTSRPDYEPLAYSHPDNIVNTSCIPMC